MYNLKEWDKIVFVTIYDEEIESKIVKFISKNENEITIEKYPHPSCSQFMETHKLINVLYYKPV